MCSGTVTTFNLAVTMKNYIQHNVPTHTPKQCEKAWWVNNSTVIHIIWSCSFLLRYQCVLWVLNSKYALLTYFIGIGSRRVEPCTWWNWRQRVPPTLCTYIPLYHQLLSIFIIILELQAAKSTVIRSLCISHCMISFVICQVREQCDCSTRTPTHSYYIHACVHEARSKENAQ